MSNQPNAFDPYHKWLGIPPSEQPPHHYRLLGIEVFESDPDIISNAADQRMAHLRTFAMGEYSQLSQQLLNEVSTARVQLLNVAQKLAYDEALKLILARQSSAKKKPPVAKSPAPPMPASSPLAASSPLPPSVPAAPSAPLAPSVAASGASAPVVNNPDAATGTIGNKNIQTTSSKMPLILGGVGAVVVGLVLLLIFSGNDTPNVADNETPNNENNQANANNNGADSNNGGSNNGGSNNPNAGTGNTGTDPRNVPEVRPVSSGNNTTNNTGSSSNHGTSGTGRTNTHSNVDPVTGEADGHEGAARPSWEQGPPPHVTGGTTSKKPRLLGDLLDELPDRGRTTTVGSSGTTSHTNITSPRTTYIRPASNGSWKLPYGGDTDLDLQVPSTVRYSTTTTPEGYRKLLYQDGTIVINSNNSGNLLIRIGDRCLIIRRSTRRVLSEQELTDLNHKIMLASTESREPLPAVERIPVPEKAALDEAEKIVMEIYATEFKEADTPEEMLILARQMHDEGIKTKDDPAGQFVLLKKAYELSAETGNMNSASLYLDSMSSIFKFDTLIPRIMAFEKAVPIVAKNGTDDECADLVSTMKDLSNEALEANNIEGAVEVLKAVMPAARRLRDKVLLASISKASIEANTLKSRWEKVKQAGFTLKSDPDNAKANSEAGKWFALIVSNWERGLPYLAKCDDEALAEAAELDVAGPDTATKQKLAGDKWWDLSEDGSFTSIEKSRLKDRAIHWYNQAMPGLSGLTKISVQKRLGEVAEEADEDNYCLYFDGRSYVATPLKFLTKTSPLTIEAIVKVDSTSTGYSDKTIVSNGYRTGFSLQSDYRYWEFEAYGNTDYNSAVLYKANSTSYLTTGQWVHLAGVYNGTICQLYVNGTCVETVAMSYYHHVSPLPFIIGAKPTSTAIANGPAALSYYFTGYIKGVRFTMGARYLKSFTAPNTLFKDRNTTALYRFNEGTGDIAHDAAGNADAKIFGAEWTKIID